MKKQNILLLSIIILMVLAICIIGILMSMKHQEEDMIVKEYEGLTEREIAENLTEVTDRTNYYVVQNCVEKYYQYYSEIFDEEYEGYLIETEEDKAEIKAERVEKVYKMLDDEYLEYEGITLENLASKLPKVEYTTIVIKNMYYIEKNQRISAYLVFGTSSGTLNSKATDFSIMVKVDYQNRTFKILLGDKVESYYKDLQNGQKLEIKEDEIENDKYNTFSYEYISDTEYINDLFRHFKRSLRLSKEESYSLLDENYKKICFENVEEYLSYLDLNYSKIVSSRVEEYSQEDKDNYTEYVFKDKKGNYYVFKETAPFKYTVMLDNYTIPTGDTKEQYTSSSDAKKVLLNIKKFFMGIDEKNYGYSYNVLAESFRNNNYPTKNDFINFAKQNFFEQNKIEYITYEKENGLYIYKIKVLDATGKDTTEKKFNIIIKLGSGTNFEMSFGTN